MGGAHHGQTDPMAPPRWPGLTLSLRWCQIERTITLALPQYSVTSYEEKQALYSTGTRVKGEGFLGVWSAEE